MTRIAIDAMGGDHAPFEIVAGAVWAAPDDHPGRRSGRNGQQRNVGIVRQPQTGKENEMKKKKYVCTICGYVYDPAQNDGVAFEDLPSDWVCPLCGAGKDAFTEVP